jgi:hypothetical protein
MCQNRSHPQANFCKCLVGGSLIKERNSRHPVYIQSPTGATKVSQQRLRDTFPVLFNDARRSGNRVIDPIHRLSPFFESIYDREECEEAMKLIISTLQHTPCHYPPCPDFAFDPVLESYLDRLKLAFRSGDPYLYDDELQRYLDFMRAFNDLQGPLGRDDFPKRRLYPHIHDRGVGMGPRLDTLIQEMALRFLPSIASGAGPEEIFRHIQNHHRLTGNGTTMVRKLIDDLRIGELEELYEFAYWVAIQTGNMLAHKIVKIIDGEPADREEYIRFLRQIGGLSI